MHPLLPSSWKVFSTAAMDSVKKLKIDTLFVSGILMVWVIFLPSTVLDVQTSRLESRGQLILKVLSCTKEEHHSLLQKYFITLWEVCAVHEVWVYKKRCEFQLVLFLIFSKILDSLCFLTLKKIIVCVSYFLLLKSENVSKFTIFPQFLFFDVEKIILWS